MKKLEKWNETITTVDTVNWKGEPIQVTNVKVLRNNKTGEILVYPFELANAEVTQMTTEHGLCPRDASTLMILIAKPGNFNEGDVFYKYHLQKMLFLFWKSVEEVYGAALPLDKFKAAENGPMPEQLNDDLTRLEEKGLIKTHCENTEYGKVKKITLTGEGTQIAKELWRNLPDPYKETAIRVKEKLYPMTPEEVRHLIHKKFPEYRDSYVKNDIE